MCPRRTVALAEEKGGPVDWSNNINKSEDGG